MYVTKESKKIHELIKEIVNELNLEGLEICVTSSSNPKLHIIVLLPTLQTTITPFKMTISHDDSLVESLDNLNGESIKLHIKEKMRAHYINN